MKKRFAVAGATLLFLLGGCAFLSSPGPTRGGQNDHDHCRDSGAACMLAIQVPEGCTEGTCITVDPDPMTAQEGKHLLMLWKLPPKYVFCAATNDGIEVKKDPDQQFSDGGATDDPRGGKGSGARELPMYRLKDANTAKGNFPYTLRFHARNDCSGTQLKRDPVIINDM